jgi:hypothetical protein
MSERSEHGPLESALAGLQPVPAALDRDRLMFAAGQAAATPAPGRLWPAATAVLLCLSVALTVALVVRPEPRESVRTVYLPAPSGSPDRASDPRPPEPAPSPPPAPLDRMLADTTPSAGGGDYLRLRSQVLRFGAESLPEPLPLSSGSKPLSVESLLEMPKKQS